MSIKTIQNDLKTKNISGQIITLNNLFIDLSTREDENKIKSLTGFSGSNALLFITPSKCYLFTDNRYALQAHQEVNTKIIDIQIITSSTIQALIDFLKKYYSNSTPNIIYNPWEITSHFVSLLTNNLPSINFIEDPNAKINLSPVISQTFVHAKKFSGLSTKEKISLFTKFMKKQKIKHYLITSSTNLSWLLNLRSNALQYSPVFRGYALINKDGSYKVFANSTDLRNSLPLEDLPNHLQPLTKLATDFTTTPYKIIQKIPHIINIKDPIFELKSIKNKTELKGFQNAHIRDGVALTKFLYWLSKNNSNLTELDIATKLSSFRQKEENYYSESFNTISASGPNGAIVHYAPTLKTNRSTKKDALLLLDSGAQYLDGTTDITRTIAINPPTEDMKEKYTLVLKAHIALSSAIFPEETSGEKLDILARNVLLKHNLNYAHGTGHGVGHFSNVHEGPNNISIYHNSNTPLKKSMITSIEPGFYKENHYGIRIENLYYITSHQKTKYLCFAPLTFVPFDKNLILPHLLTTEEKDYINTYHKQIYKNLKKYLTTLEQNWLKTQTTPI